MQSKNFYCINVKCPFRDCEWHLSQLNFTGIPVKLVYKDKFCDRFLNYLNGVMER